MAINKEIKINVDAKGAKRSIKGVKDGLDDTGKASGKVNDKLDTLTGGAISKFRKMTGTLKTVATGFKGIGFAIAASGIGLLVITIGAVIAAFKSSEEGQNKFAKLMGVIGSVTGNVMDLVTDFGDAVIWAFEEPQKAIEKLGDLIAENVINRFVGLLELVPALGSAIDEALSGNFSAGAKIAADALGKVALGVENVTDKTGAYISEIEREAKTAAGIADMRAKADKIERKLLTEKAEAERRIAELREISARKDLYNIEERKAALVEAGKINTSITEKEIGAAKLRRDAIVAENKLSKSNKDDLKAEEQAKADLINLETQSLKLQKSISAELSSVNKQALAEADALTKAAQEKLDADLKIAEEKASEEAKTERERLEKIEEIRAEYRRKSQDLEDETELEKIERTQERELLELDRLDASEQQKADIKLYYSRLISDENTRLKLSEEQKLQAIEDESSKKKMQLQKSVQGATVDIASQTIGLVGQIAKEGSDLAKGLAVAQATVKGYEGAQNAFTTAAASPITSVFPAYPFVQAGLAGAFSAVQIGKILSTKMDGKGAAPRLSNGGGSRSSAPSFNVVKGTGDNQISESIQAQNKKPVQAFVVSKSVTSQQELDRNIIDDASI